MTQLVVWTRNLHTTMGQHVALVGEHPVLHQWKPTEPSSWMECLGDGVWVIRVSLPPDSVQEFKLAVATNSNVVAWQDGPNRLLEVPKQAAEVHVAWESTELMLRPLSALHAPDTEGAIRVMTFNCRYDTPSDDKNRWAYRKESFIRAIREQQPDFLGIQEALHHQLQDIRQGLPWYDVLGKGRDDGHESGEYSPIFYLKTKFHCLERFVCHSFLVSLSNWTSLSFGLDLPLTLAGLQVVEFAPGAVSRLPR